MSITEFRTRNRNLCKTMKRENQWTGGNNFIIAAASSKLNQAILRPAHFSRNRRLGDDLYKLVVQIRLV